MCSVIGRRTNPYILNNIQDQRSYPEKSYLSSYRISCFIYQVNSSTGMFTHNQFPYAIQKEMEQEKSNSKSK